MNAPNSSAQAQSWRRRTAAVFAAVGALIMSSGLVMITAPAANAASVGICHADGSDKNPYNFISVDSSSTDYQGHLEHAQTPQFTWKKGTWWNGTWFPAGTPKPDLISSTIAGAPITSAYCNAEGTGAISVVPSVTFTNPSCANNNTPSWSGTSLDKVEYTVSSGAVAASQAVVVSALAKAGYEFPNNAATSFPHTFGPLQACATLGVVDPLVTQPACTGPGTSSPLQVVLASTPTGVSYGFDPAVAPLTVTATVTDPTKTFEASLGQGWTRVDATHATYLVTSTPAGACLTIVSASAPTATAPTCITPGHLVLPSVVGDGYSWTGDTADVPGDHTVTAVADTGYQLSGQSQWTVRVRAAGEGLACGGGGGGGTPDPVIPDPEVTTVDPNYPSANDATCSRNGELFVPAQPDGVLVTQSGSVPGDVTFTFAPAEGFAFADGTDTEVTVPVEAKLGGDECILGEEATKPKPKPKPRDRAPIVLGSQAAVPTAVAAGLSGLPTTSVSSTSSPRLAQALVAGGLLMLIAGGSMGLGRRTRGAHES